MHWQNHVVRFIVFQINGKTTHQGCYYILIWTLDQQTNSPIPGFMGYGSYWEPLSLWYCHYKTTHQIVWHIAHNLLWYGRIPICCASTGTPKILRAWILWGWSIRWAHAWQRLGVRGNSWHQRSLRSIRIIIQMFIMKTMPSWTEFWSEVLIEKQTNQEMELDHVVAILVLIMV